MIEVVTSTALDWLKGMPDNSATALLSDTPYGLGKAPDPAVLLRSWLDGIEHDTGPGFMGQDWDVVPGPAVWKEAYRVLKPGAVMLLFGGTRTIDLLGISVRLAGFEIFDMVAWLYGQGWSKSGLWQRKQEFQDLGIAETWDGYASHLKPAMEPIICARKPREGTYANTANLYGTGGLWIDGTRIPVNAEVDDPRLGGKGTWDTSNAAKNVYGKFAGTETDSSPLGRWPADIIHDGSAEVMDLFPHTASGTGAVKKESGAGYSPASFGKESRPAGTPNVEYGDSGSASRFFYVAKPSKSEKLAGLAADAERHTTTKPLALTEYLAKMILPPAQYRDEAVLLVPYCGIASEVIGAVKAGWQNVRGCDIKPNYIAIGEQRIAHWCSQLSFLQE